MGLILPVTGVELKFQNKHIKRLARELRAEGTTIGALAEQNPWEAASRLIQTGYAWQGTLTEDEADDIVDRERDGGVDFRELMGGLSNAFLGRPATVTIDEPETDAETAPKKTNGADGPPVPMP